MTTSTKSHPTHKKTSPATSEAASVAPEPSDATPASPSLATLAKTATATLQAIAASIPFYDPSPKDLKAARVATRVPVAALAVAATILEQNPDRYPDFDAATTRDAADYVTAMLPLSEQMSALQLRLARSIFNRHGQGASETLALYQTVKGLSRLASGKDALSQQKALAKAMVKTTKKKRATSVTGAELETAAKGIRASKKAAAKNQQAANVMAEAQTATAVAKLVNGPSDASTTSAAPAAAAASTTAAPPAAPTSPAN